MTYLVFTALQERDAYRLATAIDKLLGYPRNHPEGELRRRGGGPFASVVRTETQPQILRLADGRYAVSVDGAVRALDGQQTTVLDGTSRVVTIATAAAVEQNTEGATLIQPRGGILP